MSIDLILGADSISPPLTGIGRYAFELAKGLHRHAGMGRVRYFSLGRWVSLESLLHADTAPPSTQRSVRSILAGNRAAVQAFRLLMPSLQRLRLRHALVEIFFHGQGSQQSLHLFAAFRA